MTSSRAEVGIVATPPLWGCIELGGPELGIELGGAEPLIGGTEDGSASSSSSAARLPSSKAPIGNDWRIIASPVAPAAACTLISSAHLPMSSKPESLSGSS